jgi:hypothetical protein
MQTNTQKWLVTLVQMSAVQRKRQGKSRVILVEYDGSMSPVAVELAEELKQNEALELEGSIVKVVDLRRAD